MKVNANTIKRLIKSILLNENHRLILTASKTDASISFFNDFLNSISERKTLTNDHSFNGLFQGIEESFFGEYLSSISIEEEKAKNLGIPGKTIGDAMGSKSKEKINEGIRLFQPIIDQIISEKNFDLQQVKLNFSDSSHVINSEEFMKLLLASSTWISAINGGFNSSFGKQIEKPIMLTLCKIFNVDQSNYHEYDQLDEGDYSRETDFYLRGSRQRDIKCEVKMMGRGNPESIDSAWRKGVKVFVGFEISETGKREANDKGVHTLELRDKLWIKFDKILNHFKIPNSFDEDWEENIDDYLDEIFS